MLHLDVDSHSFFELRFHFGDGVVEVFFPCGGFFRVLFVLFFEIISSEWIRIEIVVSGGDSEKYYLLRNPMGFPNLIIYKVKAKTITLRFLPLVCLTVFLLRR